MVYLDNSATSYPKPKSVYHMYKNAIKYYYSNPGRGGYENALLCAEKIYETRKKIADFFGESNEENVVFTANCTAAVNLVMKGLLKSGDHVLISDLEHNAVLRCVDKLRRESGIKYDIFQTDFYDDEKTLQSVKKLVQPNTKLIFCTHASNVLGVCLPIAKIGAFCYISCLVGSYRHFGGRYPGDNSGDVLYQNVIKGGNIPLCACVYADGYNKVRSCRHSRLGA